MSADVQAAPAESPPPGPPPAPDRRRIELGQRTLRRDNWWIEPAFTALLLIGFVAYGTWRAFEGQYFFTEPYLAPFYSPCLSAVCATEGAPHWAWFPWAGISPALYILAFPGGFRATCYYYRKAYYRSLWLSPPGCAVGEPHKSYTGETRFPLVLNNLHRYFWYVAMLFGVILTWEALRSFWIPGEGFHIGLGSIILTINAILIWGYTLGCHSCRHIMAGKLNSFSKHPMRYKFWVFVSTLNGKHREWALYSMVWIVFADFYVRSVAAGTISGSWV